MDTKEYRKVQCEHTEERLLKKLDRILDDAEDEGCLDEEDVHLIKDIWKSIWYAKQCCKA